MVVARLCRTFEAILHGSGACVLREGLGCQLPVVCSGFGVVLVCSGHDRCVFRKLIKLSRAEGFARLGCDGGIFVDPSLGGVDLLEALECRRRLLRVVILFHDRCILTDGLFRVSALLIDHSDFVQRPSCVGAAGIFRGEEGEGVHGRIAVPAEHVCPSLLEECVVGIIRAFV